MSCLTIFCSVSDKIEKMTHEMEALRVGHQKAEEQSQEANTRLNVLSAYFKEKEVELQK